MNKGQGQPVDRYVLSKMGTDEIRLFEQRFDIVEEAVEVVCSGWNRPVHEQY